MRKVKKVKKIGNRKVVRLCRKFGIAPLAVRALQSGAVVELPSEKAALLVAAGYVRYIKKATKEPKVIEPSPHIIKERSYDRWLPDDKETIIDDESFTL